MKAERDSPDHQLTDQIGPNDRAPRPHDWVFGYGSLMWRPGFAYAERRSAMLFGRHRSFCIYSVYHRGTPERRGLVLGLAPGGATRGIAYRVAPQDWVEVRAYLKEREQPSETYIESRARLRLLSGTRIEALVYVSDRRHVQWAGRLSLEAQAALIAGATGRSGRNIDYLADLVRHLKEEGIEDAAMERLLARVEEIERGC